MWCCGWVMRILFRDRRFVSIGALLGVWGSTGLCVLVGPLSWAGGGCLLVRVGVVLCENCIVDASIFLFCVLVLFTLIVCVSVCFVTGVWWMPWHAEPMKDV